MTSSESQPFESPFVFGGVSSGYGQTTLDLRTVVTDAQHGGWRVRATLDDGSEVIGAVTSADDSLMRIAENSVHFQQVVHFDKWSRSRGSGSIIGGAIGTAIGLGLASFATGDAKCPSCGLGVILLGGLGFVIGSASSHGGHWDEVWRRN